MASGAGIAMLFKFMVEARNKDELQANISKVVKIWFPNTEWQIQSIEYIESIIDEKNPKNPPIEVFSVIVEIYNVRNWLVKAHGKQVQAD